MGKKEKDDLSDVLLLLTDLLNNAGLSGHFLETLESSVDKLEKILVGEICHKCKDADIPIQVRNSDSDGNIPWIQCECCFKWYHQDCVGLQGATEGTPFKCCGTSASSLGQSISGVQNVSTAAIVPTTSGVKFSSESPEDSESESTDGYLDFQTPPKHLKLPPKTRENGKTTSIAINPLHLPARHRNLIITDSQGRKIDEMVLDREGCTKVMVLPGMSFRKFAERVVQSNRPPHEEVKTVTMFLGGNDLEHRDAKEFMVDVKKSVALVKERFPAASIKITDVLPRHDCRDPDVARHMLADFCRKEEIKLINLDALHPDDFARDKKHLNWSGIRKVCSRLKSALRLSSRNSHRGSNNSSNRNSSRFSGRPGFRAPRSTSGRNANFNNQEQHRAPRREHRRRSPNRRFQPTMPDLSRPPPSFPTSKSMRSQRPAQDDRFYSDQGNWPTPSHLIDPNANIPGTGVTFSALARFLQGNVRV